MTREPPEIPNVTPIRKGRVEYSYNNAASFETPFHVDPGEFYAAPGLPDLVREASKPKTAPGLTPYGYLMEIMRDTDADPYLRVMAAEALMPYCHKKE